MPSRAVKRAIIIFIFAALATAVQAQSIGGMSGLGPLVSKASSGGGGGGGGCTPTGLLFNVACNSQYIPLIH
jgi:hypothetical protein